MTNDSRNRVTKSRKNQNTRKNENLHILGNIGSEQHQTSRDERKNWKRLHQENGKTTRNQTIIEEISSKGWTLGLSSLEDTRDHSWSERGKNFTKWTREKENVRWLRPYIPEMTLTDYKYQEKKEGEDSPAFKKTSTHRYKDTNTT